MQDRWDIAIYDRNDRLALAVEVKNILNTTREWAAQFRNNLLAHRTFPLTPYFLLALPDRFYLWLESDVATGLEEPDYIVNARPILEPYFQQMGLTAETISGLNFELIIGLWLGSILSFQEQDEFSGSWPDWLVESGLQRTIAGGRFHHEVLV